MLGEVFEAIDEKHLALTHRTLDLFWARLAMHIRAEHLHLFPAVLGDAADGEIVRTISSLHDDHDFFMRELAKLIKLMRNGDAGVLARVREDLDSVRRRLVVHNRVEEKRIYRIADPESHALIDSIQTEISNLPPRFADGTMGE